MSQGTIKKVAGPLVIAEGMRDANMFDVVRVSENRLIGEIIEMHGDQASIQVYEETSGLGPGEPVYSTEMPLSVELGPGLISSIYDGIQRPLNKIMEKTGTNNLSRGVEVDALDRSLKWDFVPVCKVGDELTNGDVIGTVKETAVVTQKIMVPYGISGTVKEIKAGSFSVDETVCILSTGNGDKELTMMQKWPVRRGRPYKEKVPPVKPLITRGNEMTDVLNEFPELVDPRTGESLMQRTVLIANTSDMPVAAREASIYTGITMAEYFRDMGYSVALMADSTSRWAEALREMSGRLEEMPGEEGYPAYLASRLAQFYERAGHVIALGSEGREGQLSAIGAVSPPGGDISEPVSQATLRIVKVFWGLDADLAHQRHFPAINWLTSYSLYLDSMAPWFNENVAPDWMSTRQKLMTLLQEEDNLNEIVKMVGMDALSPVDRLKMEAARSIREDFLHQNSFDEIDTYTSLGKQYNMMKLVYAFYEQGLKALDAGAKINDLVKMEVRERIGRYKYTREDDIAAEYEKILGELAAEISGLINKEGR